MTGYQNYNSEVPTQTNTAETNGRVHGLPGDVYDK